MSSGTVALGDIAGRITMLEAACYRCERHLTDNCRQVFSLSGASGK
jgi:hypothetical protein